MKLATVRILVMFFLTYTIYRGAGLASAAGFFYLALSLESFAWAAREIIREFKKAQEGGEE